MLNNLLIRIELLCVYYNYSLVSYLSISKLTKLLIVMRGTLEIG